MACKLRLSVFEETLRIRASSPLSARQLRSTLCLYEPVCNEWTTTCLSEHLQPTLCLCEPVNVKIGTWCNRLRRSLRKAQCVFPQRGFLCVGRCGVISYIGNMPKIILRASEDIRDTNMIMIMKGHAWFILRASVDIPIWSLLFWSVRIQEKKIMDLGLQDLTPRAAKSEQIYALYEVLYEWCNH